jgi:hypothetical protein
MHSILCITKIGLMIREQCVYRIWPTGIIIVTTGLTVTAYQEMYSLLTNASNITNRNQVTQ